MGGGGFSVFVDGIGDRVFCGRERFMPYGATLDEMRARLTPRGGRLKGSLTGHTLHLRTGHPLHLKRAAGAAVGSEKDAVARYECDGGTSAVRSDGEPKRESAERTLHRVRHQPAHGLHLAEKVCSRWFQSGSEPQSADAELYAKFS